MFEHDVLESATLSEKSTMTEAVVATESNRELRDAVEPEPMKHKAASQSDFVEDLRYILGY